MRSLVFAALAVLAGCADVTIDSGPVEADPQVLQCYADLSVCSNYIDEQWQGDEAIELCGMPYVCPVDYHADAYPDVPDDWVCVVFLNKDCLTANFPEDS